MSTKLLKLASNINTVIKTADYNIIFESLCRELAFFAKAGVVLLDTGGKIIYMDTPQDGCIIFNIREHADSRSVDQQLNERLKNIVSPMGNIGLKSLQIKNQTADAERYLCAVWPVGASGGRMGTLIMYRSDAEYSDEDMAAAGFCSAIAGIVMRQMKSAQSADEARRVGVVKAAIATLSYTELSAVLHIFEELDGVEGLVIASKVADKTRITRSVIVNALRKLESAGLIESRSLGMKGTYIKVFNELLINELDKIRG